MFDFFDRLLMHPHNSRACGRGVNPSIKFAIFIALVE